MDTGIQFVYNFWQKNQANPSSANALNLRDAAKKQLQTDLSEKPSFRCRRETYGSKLELETKCT